MKISKQVIMQLKELPRIETPNFKTDVWICYDKF